MKKIVLVGINSQFVHTNLAIRYLKKYIEKYSELRINLYETNINNKTYNILRDIYALKPDVVIFSTYVWNKMMIFELITELKKLLSNVKIILGGPEVSYDPQNILNKYEEIDALILSEGERALLNYLSDATCKEGIALRENGKICINKNARPIQNLDEIPYPYEESELDSNNLILYYESSRGCPFSCSYCMSSIEKSVRYFSIQRVKQDLEKFLKSNVKLVKFVDRTFNINRKRYLEIWEFLLANYRKGICFHFEINANILNDEDIEFLKKVPKDYFQFEIGVQTIKEDTMREIKRYNNLALLEKNVKNISKNIHLHVDLIAGLPHEDYDSFKKSFNYVHNLGADMIQLGFLKILKGTLLSTQLDEFNYEYMHTPPYEIIKNSKMSFDDLIRLKNVEKILDYYYNSGDFSYSLNYILDCYENTFDFYENMANFFVEKKLMDIAHKKDKLYDYFYDFVKVNHMEKLDVYAEYLKFDYLKKEKKSSYPHWLVSEKDKDKLYEIVKTMNFSSMREAHKKTEIESFSIDVFEGIKRRCDIFFNYESGIHSILSR